MRRFNTYDLYQLGNALRPLADLKPEMQLNQAFWPLISARAPLEALLSNQMIQVVYCRAAAQQMLNAINAVLEPIFNQQGDQQADWNAEIGQPFTFQITGALQAFEHVLAAELQQKTRTWCFPRVFSRPLS